MSENNAPESMPSISDVNLARRAVRLGFPLTDATKALLVNDIDRVLKSDKARDRMKLAMAKLAVEMEKVNVVVEQRRLNPPERTAEPTEAITMSGAGHVVERVEKPVAGADFRKFIAELRNVDRPAPGEAGANA